MSRRLKTTSQRDVTVSANVNANANRRETHGGIGLHAASASAAYLGNNDRLSQLNFPRSTIVLGYGQYHPLSQVD